MAVPEEPQSVDFRPLKAAAARLMPVGHPLREAFLAEPDELPLDVAAVKIATYVRLARAMGRKRAGV